VPKEAAMTTNGIDHGVMHHGLVRILDVVAMILTLLVIAYGLVNPPATLFPLSNMVISAVPPAPIPVSGARPDPTKDAQGSRPCAQERGAPGDCAAP
jgi:hypothetical protein